MYGIRIKDRFKKQTWLGRIRAAERALGLDTPPVLEEQQRALNSIPFSDALNAFRRHMGALKGKLPEYLTGHAFRVPDFWIDNSRMGQMVHNSKVSSGNNHKKTTLDHLGSKIIFYFIRDAFTTTSSPWTNEIVLHWRDTAIQFDGDFAETEDALGIMREGDQRTRESWMIKAARQTSQFKSLASEINAFSDNLYIRPIVRKSKFSDVHFELALAIRTKDKTNINDTIHAAHKVHFDEATYARDIQKERKDLSRRQSRRKVRDSTYSPHEIIALQARARNRTYLPRGMNPHRKKRIIADLRLNS